MREMLNGIREKSIRRLRNMRKNPIVQPKKIAKSGFYQSHLRSCSPREFWNLDALKHFNAIEDKLFLLKMFGKFIDTSFCTFFFL